jgi:hypothetical protein
MLGWAALALAALLILGQFNILVSAAPARLISGLAVLALAATALWGYWSLRRWGLWVASMIMAARVAAGAAGVLTLRPGDLAWPAALLLVGLFYYRRLR